MVEVEIIPLQTANTLRQKAVQVSPQLDFARDLPQGWSISLKEPDRLFDVFITLKLREDICLNAYQFREGEDGEGVVWALPQGAAFSEPKSCFDEEEEMPIPERSLNDFMLAVDGDGSALSYLSSSLLARQLLEWGAFGNGVYWGTFKILGVNPLDNSRMINNSDPKQGPTGSPEQWIWEGIRPAEWQPVVATKGVDRVNVTFYTYCGQDYQRITRHVDEYEAGSYILQTIDEVIARGPKGYFI
jgi:hypothetical protein